MRWRSGDEECVRLAIVQLHECGLGTEEALAAAFGRRLRSVQRYAADFAGEGMQGLIPEGGKHKMFEILRAPTAAKLAEKRRLRVGAFKISNIFGWD